MLFIRKDEGKSKRKEIENKALGLEKKGILIEKTKFFMSR